MAGTHEEKERRGGGIIEVLTDGGTLGHRRVQYLDSIYTVASASGVALFCVMVILQIEIEAPKLTATGYVR